MLKESYQLSDAQSQFAFPAEGESAAADKQAFFSTPSTEDLIQQLVHIAQFGDGLPVVQGVGGAGKTSLAQCLLSKLSSVEHLTHIACEYDTSLGDLFAEITQKFGLSSGSDDLSAGELLAELRHFSQALLQDNSLAILVIDDAHHINNESLGALLSLLQGSAASGYGLRMVFFSRPGLIERIDEMRLIDVSVYDFDIPAFSEQETTSFIDARALFLEGDKELSAEDRNEIWSASEGNPGQILRLLKEKLKPEKASAKSAGFNGIPIAHGAALAVLVSVLVWAIVVREDSDSAAERRETSSASDIVLTPEVVGTRTSDRGQHSENVVNQGAGSSELESSKQADGEERANSESQMDAAEKDAQLAAVQVQSDITSSVPKVSEPNISKPNISKPSVPKPNVPKLVAEPVKPKVPDPVPKASEVAKKASAEKVDTRSPANSKNRFLGVDLATGEKLGGKDDSLFLLEQNPKSFTLQVVAASKKAALIDYINSQPNKSEMFIYRGLREGKRWYVVLAGLYPSKKAAQQAIKNLPDTQKRAGPWPRSLASIQEEIAENRRN